MEFIGIILKHIMEYINALGYLGIAIGMLIESACIPLPSEVVLPLGGNMVHANPSLTLLGINAAAAIGSLTGSLIAYLVGYYGGRPFILKYGRYFFVSKEHFLTAEKMFQKYGLPCVGFGRLLPVVRTFISLPAGIAKLNIWKFLLSSFVGMLPWNFMLIYAGYYFGENYDKVFSPIFHRYEYVVIAAFAVLVAAFLLKTFLRKKRDREK